MGLDTLQACDHNDLTMTAHKPITNSYSLRLNKSTDIWCNDRPVMGWQGLTVEQAANCLNKVADELGPFLVATFKLTHHEDVPSIEKQIAAKRRRLDKLCKLIGRCVVRYETDNVSNVHFYLSR